MSMLPPASKIALTSSLINDIFGAMDSTTAKLHIINKGYYIDPFLHFFHKKPEAKPQVINRGYFARVYSVLQLVVSFFRAFPGPKQLVSLGAGFDSYFFLLYRYIESDLSLWLEIDLPEVVNAKNSVYDEHLRPEGRVKQKIVEGDLLNPKSVKDAMEKAGFNFNLPTLYLLECVSAYLVPECLQALLTAARSNFAVVSPSSYSSTSFPSPSSSLTFTAADSAGGSSGASDNGTTTATANADDTSTPSPSSFSSSSSSSSSTSSTTPTTAPNPKPNIPLMFIAYDPIVKPNDNFGKVMVNNLKKRGIVMPSLMEWSTPQERIAFVSNTCGWDSATCTDMVKAYAKIPQAERERIHRLEMLDEFEEFNLLLSHYYIWSGYVMLDPNSQVGLGINTTGFNLKP